MYRKAYFGFRRKENNMKENIVTGKKYRVLINEKDDEWDRVSFWTSSADVECENGEDMETRSEKLQGVCLTQTLSAGATTITFTDPSITKDCFIDFYTDAYGVNPENVDYKEDGQVTLLFEEQEKDVRVRIKIREI